MPEHPYLQWPVFRRSVVAAFQRSLTAKTLASLNHPHIATIYAVEKSAGITALVMELVEGDDLSQRIEAHWAHGSGMPIDEALPIARHIADALEAAHEQNIIHRDLKPANIKVRADGTVKVLDFGLAKAVEAGGAGRNTASMSPTLSLHATQAGMILGTAAYMSPEQARGRAVDKRCDIWAFGCVLFEMLTGRFSECFPRAVEREAERLLRERHPERALRANVEFYTAVLLEAIGIPRALFSPTFAASRVAGWCTHVDEQRRVGRLIRPASTYVGP